MSWWNAKYTNNNGEYEITFASKDYEKAKAVEKVCCAVMDKVVKSSFDVEVVVRCRECKLWHEETGFCEKNSYFVDGDGVCCSPADSPNWTMFNPDDFCSYGERKEGE